MQGQRLTVADFSSYDALGVAPRRSLTPEQARLRSGISVYRSLARARWRAAGLTPPHRFVARLDLEDEGPFTWEQTGRDPDHVTVWGDPHELLARVQGEPVPVPASE